MITQISSQAIINFIHIKELTREKITQFMADCRTIIEFNALHNKYPILFFYCNWSLHPNIDKNPFLYNILGNISELFTGKSGKYGYNIAPLIKINVLLKEIVDFLNDEFNNNQFALTDKYLQNLTCAIFKNLCGRRLHFPDKRNVKKFDDIIKNTKLIHQTPIIISSINVKAVEHNIICFEMYLDDYTYTERGVEPKNLTVLQNLTVNLNLNNNTLNFNFS